MNMKKIRSQIVLWLFILPIALNTYAQESRSQIAGYVLDPEKQPAEYSTAVLMNQDSVVMGGTLVGEDGLFLFENLDKGQYLIMIRNVEFNTFVSEQVTLDGRNRVEFEPIQLERKLNDIEEVVIRGEKAMVEVHPDKMVYNVSASVNSSGNNALELLSKSPGVQVDMDKNIILQGKTGVQIYLNGRPSRISGSDLADMLEGMRSENIESIEIITNPSSKYDAEGSGGIINIVMKKDVSTGFNGSLNANYSLGVEPRAGVGTNLNYSGSKVNLFSSLNYSDNNYTFNRDEIMILNDYSLDMASLRPTNRKGINFSAGMDYKISNEHTLSLDARILTSDRSSPQTSNTLIEDMGGVNDSERLLAETIDEGGNSNYNANLHYSFVPNRSAEFSADVSFGKYSSDKLTNQPNAYYSLDSVLLRSSESEYEALTDISLFSAQADYSKSMQKVKISTGAKYSYISTNNQLEFFDIIDGTPVLNIDRSNDFTYMEQVAAAYFIFNMKPSDRWSFNAGMRVEHTSSLGELISAKPGPDDVVPRNYISFFPNLSASYSDQENHALSLSYGRRITRPDYQSLNPFESRLSELATWKGNPFLEPNYIDNYQLSYQFRRKLVISNTFSITHNYFSRIFEIDGEIGNVISPQNMDRAIINGLSASYPQKLTKWWQFSTFFLYNYEKYQGDINGTLIDVKAHVINFRMQNDIRLPLDIQVEVSAYINGPSVWGGTTRIDGYYSIDAGLKREFLDDRILLQASVRDLFNTGSLYRYSSDYGGMLIDGTAFFDGRRIMLNATYKFGNSKVKTRKSNSAIQEELRRISD